MLPGALGALGARHTLHTLPHRHTTALHRLSLSFNPFHNKCASIHQLIDCSLL